MNNFLFDGLPMLQEAYPAQHATGVALDIFFAPEQIVPAAKRLLENGYHLEDLSGLDTAEGIVVNYHFDHFELPGRVVLRVMAPHEAPSVPSIAAVYHGAEWHERELTDFYGVAFAGNPNPVALLLPADEAITPLVKSEKARVSVSELFSYESVAFRDPGFDLFARADHPEPPDKEAAN